MSATLIWEGRPLETAGDVIDGATQAERDGKAAEFLAAYRAVSEHADANLGYLIGYIEPPERRRELYAAFDLQHPIFGGQP